MKTTNTLEILDLKKIKIGNSNPRKTFEPHSLQELSESIKSKGVLQPILVRPKGEGYELICGERRYKASVMAELEKIPASIRDLSDDEAFEAQIVENLERKDVHPLEEADAFQRMLDSKRYTIADISSKMAKSEVFITHRLKLTNLIDEIKQDFYEDKIGIGHAVLIARLTPEAQKEILEYSKQGWGTEGYGTVNQLRSKIDQGLYSLKNAAFKTTDEKLLPEIGSCINCLKRSGANPVLFADVEDENKCFDASCFGKKMKAHIMREIEKIVSGGKEIFLLAGYTSQPDKEVLEYVKNFKVPILKEYDEFTTYDYNGSNSKKVKGFYIQGSEAGKFKSIYLKLKGKNIPDLEDPIKEQVTKIKERAKRALELDNVKIFQALKKSDLYRDYENLDGDLTELETKAAWFLFRNEIVGYHRTRHDDKLPKTPDSYRDTKEFHFYENAKLEDLKINTLVRMAIKDKLSNMHEPNFESCTRSKFFFEILKEFSPQTVTEAIQAQKEIASKRISRSKLKLKEIEHKQESPAKEKSKKSKKKS